MFSCELEKIKKMSEFFMHNRNEWELTPLERIQKSIFELNQKLFDERINLAALSDSTEYFEKSNEIVRLERTLGILIDESVERQKTVKRLNFRRENFMHEVSCIRYQGGSKRRLNRIFKWIKMIDTELGPYRWSSQPFRLE